MISASERKLKAEELRLTIVVDSENSANERTNEQRQGKKDRSFTHTAFSGFVDLIRMRTYVRGG